MTSEAAGEILPHSPLSRAENFRSRLLIGSTVVLFSNVIFAGADLWLESANLPLLWACKLVQVVEILFVRYRLRHGARMPEMNFLGILMVSTIVSMTALSGYISKETETTQILTIAILFASAGIVPWPRGSQLIVALVAVGSITTQQLMMRPTPSLGLLAVWSGAACSVLMADLLNRRRALVEDSERVARRREREQREITDILLSGSSSVVGGLGQGDLMRFFCEILATQLGCRWVLAIETRVDEEGPVALPVAQHGLATRDWASLHDVPMDRSLGGLIQPDYRDEIAEIRVPRNRLGQSGADAEDGELSVLLVRLRDSDTGGIVMTAWRDAASGPFGDRERTIAKGMAPLLSASLEQRRLLAELETAQLWQQNFLASLSHELRTPLNIILGYMEMLLDQDLPVSEEEAREIQKKVKWNASNQLRLVNEALELSRRDDAGSVVVRREVVDLRALLLQIVEEANLQVRGKNIVIVGEFPAELPSIRTDAVKLRIILGNLLDNARKFTIEGGISVRVELCEATITFRVKDTGRGIAPEILPELFRAFRQGERGDPGGLGLGLYIVRRLVKSLNGEVAVESVLGSGSQFSVEIPLVLAEETPAD
jgi:signal transduction histidine kinase